MSTSTAVAVNTEGSQSSNPAQRRKAEELAKKAKATISAWFQRRGKIEVGDAGGKPLIEQGKNASMESLRGGLPGAFQGEKKKGFRFPFWKNSSKPDNRLSVLLEGKNRPS